MKKYRVNESELFNLQSMYDRLKCDEIDMMEAPANSVSVRQWDELQKRLNEVENLLEKAPCIGSLVEWETLKRIREIKAERQMLRYNTCIANGATEKDAVLSFEL